jgi:hypothetical protein
VPAVGKVAAVKEGRMQGATGEQRPEVQVPSSFMEYVRGLGPPLSFFVGETALRAGS